jgi:metal-dependent amidase/aminoacylase/carboxypeptidase family protein
MLVGQPAEETISGAKKMIDDGLLSRSQDQMRAWRCMSGTKCPPDKWECARAIYWQAQIRCA